MKHVHKGLIILCISMLVQNGHSQNIYSKTYHETDSTVTDVDGNVYPVVKMGNQIWMAENLRTTHYSDGTPIEYSLRLNDVAHEDTTKRYFYYNNNSANAENYGCLYNWYAAVRGMNGSDTNPSGIQGICPEGWHLPSISEWQELRLFLGENAADQLKPGSWTGFNAQYGGTGGDDSPFQQMNTRGFYLTADAGEHFDIDPFCMIILAMIEPNNQDVWFGNHTKTCGYSMRCVKDNTNTGLMNKNVEIPQGFCLSQNYPNPFNPSTTIRFELTKSENVQLKIFDIQGQEIQTLLNDILPDGEHSIQWHAEGLPAGIYLARLQTRSGIQTKKLILQN